MTRHGASMPWPEASAEISSAQRDDAVQLGVWMFLATVVMLFAAFTSAYIIRRSASDWAPIDLPGVLWANTAVLVASSLALEWARFATRRHRTASARSGLVAATGLGGVFLVGQVAAWRALVAQGVYLPTGPYSAFVYILTGAHGVHVLAGLVLLVYAAARMWHADERPDPDLSTARLVSGAATFWHFLVGLWLYVFTLVSVF